MTILEDEQTLWKKSQRTTKRKISIEENTQCKKVMMANGDTQSTSFAPLSNMGNTCFLNSVLYTLRFAPTFLHNLHHLIGDLTTVGSRMNQTKAKTASLGRNVGAITGPSSRSTSSKDLLALSNDIIPKSKVQIVTEKLHDLYVTMHGLEVKESGDAYQPVALLQAIRDANAIFEGNHQQDAHELLLYLLDNIRETCDLLMQQVQHNPDLISDSEINPLSNNRKLWIGRRSWKKTQRKKDSKTKEAINEEQVNGTSATDTDTDSSSTNGTVKKICYNFVAEDFEGVTLRRTKCLECESVTERKEPFYDIPVPIDVKKATLENEMSKQCINEYYRNVCVTREKLCDANKYLCEECQRYNEAYRTVSFEKLPNIMVLQLKRFTTSSSGMQKLNTFVPTPLELACFCETCCNIENEEQQPHLYTLCCVIMHLGASLASGHYIAYVKASDQLDDYTECSRSMPKGSLSASSSEKSLNFLRYFKAKTIGNSLSECRSILAKSTSNGVRICKSLDCCGVKLNKNTIENVLNSYPRRNGQEMWLECDDEIVKPISSEQLEDELAYKPNSTSTPYLLFYSKVTDTTTLRD